MEKTKPLTDYLIQGKYRALDDVLIAGTLEARLGAKGTFFFWRLDEGAKTYRFKIGTYDSAAPPKSLKPTTKGFSRMAATHTANQLAHIHTGNEWRERGGYPAYLAHEEAQTLMAQAVEQKAKAEHVEIETKARAFTVAALLEQYLSHLEARQAQSLADAAYILRRHVIEAWPSLANTQAKKASAEELADVVRRLNEEGKARTANKARSYLKAAFEMATKAKTSPEIPLAFKGFAVSAAHPSRRH